MTADQLSALLHAADDSISKIFAAENAGALVAATDAIQKVRGLLADGTLQAAQAFCRKYEDSSALLWLISKFEALEAFRKYKAGIGDSQDLTGDEIQAVRELRDECNALLGE